jgi:putative endonuclease
MNKQWVVYILTCSDDTLYTGITNNLEKRIIKHNTNRGAKFCRGRTPVKLLKSFEVPDKSSALKMEYKIKQMSREEKLNL